MAINSGLVTKIFEYITPCVKKGVKSSQQTNRIHFSPSDVPIEELGKNITQELKVMDDATVAPFAQRLIHPKLFGLDPEINRRIAVVNNTRKMISQSKDDKLRTTFDKLYDKILVNTVNIPEQSDKLTTLMQKVDMIENTYIKSSMIDFLDVLAEKSDKSFKKSFHHNMLLMEDYADAVNTINGKYFRLDANTVKFRKFMNKNNIWLLDVIEGTKKDVGTYRNKLISNPKKEKEYSDYLESFDKYSQKGLSQTFENNLKTDAMKEFISVYGATRQKAVNELYHNVYLKTLPEDIAKECAEVQHKYGTYIIPENADLKAKDIQYIKEELKLWKEAGKGDEILPVVIDANTMDEYLVKSGACGCASGIERKISVRDLLEDDGKWGSVGSTLRHEIQHLQNQQEFLPQDDFVVLLKKLIWKYKKLMHSKQWEQELKNAGISNKFLIKYAFLNESELKSVTAESYMKKLSEKYKTDMVEDFNMKKWIFDIDRNKVMLESRREDFAKKLTDEAIKKYS